MHVFSSIVVKQVMLCSSWSVMLLRVDDIWFIPDYALVALLELVRAHFGFSLSPNERRETFRYYFCGFTLFHP